MKFKIEFKNDGTKFDDAITDHRKEWRQNELGKLIADAFGWTESGITSLKPSDAIKFSLEIEAFPMDKWIEFKGKLRAYLDSVNNSGFGTMNIVMIDKLFRELESFGKPSRDAITNLPDQIEYRGPNSHCKACEDEKNGVKHIMAQKHTCKK